MVKSNAAQKYICILREQPHTVMLAMAVFEYGDIKEAKEYFLTAFKEAYDYAQSNPDLPERHWSPRFFVGSVDAETELALISAALSEVEME